MSREDQIDSASLRRDLARSLLIGDAIAVASLGYVTPELIETIREHVAAYETASTEHRQLLFGAAA